MQTFEKCGLDGAKMAGLNGATVKTTVRAVTQGEGWVQDVETVLIAMLSDESQADKTAAAESEDAKGESSVPRSALLLLTFIPLHPLLLLLLLLLY